jgi:hypothetical protein
VYSIIVRKACQYFFMSFFMVHLKGGFYGSKHSLSKL